MRKVLNIFKVLKIFTDAAKGDVADQDTKVLTVHILHSQK